VPPNQQHANTIARARHLLAHGRPSEALKLAEPLARRRPGDLALTVLLAECHLRLLQRDKAFYFAERALEQRPGNPQLLLLRADAAPKSVDAERRLAFYEAAANANPGAAGAHAGMARVLVKLARSSEAASRLRRARELEPDNPAHAVALADHIAENGDARAACDILRTALADRPGDAALLRAFAIASNYAPGLEPAELAGIHRRLGDAIARPVRPNRSFRNKPDPDREIRIGVLSPDMRRHSVAFFLEPALEHLAPSMHATCYALSRAEDEFTARFREHADAWRGCHGRTHSEMARMIAEDRIDVLIDLTGHFAGSQAPVLAARPAPVSITYCGYPNTTGVPGVTARLVDSTTDPEPDADAHATERLVRLDPCFLCYRPPDEAPEPAPPEGPFTFGSFNAVKKYTPDTLDSWARILRAVPGSRLLLKHARFRQPDAQERFADAFADRGIGPDRVMLLPGTPDPADHLATYGRVHLALDPFPYNGTTTTCEALWMGVPVVAFTGDRHAARVSASVLRAAGLAELVADDPTTYEHLAIGLAQDETRLETLRSGLRQRVAGSALCDAPAFAARFEHAVRDLWRTWCRNPV